MAVMHMQRVFLVWCESVDYGYSSTAAASVNIIFDMQGSVAEGILSVVAKVSG